MKNKGFTIVEMVMAFVLAATVIFFLFNIVFILKDSYIETTKTSVLYTEQAILTQTINHDFYTVGVQKVESCKTEANDLCIKFYLANNENKTLEVTNGTNKKIKYGNYLYPLENSEDFSFDNEYNNIINTAIEGCIQENVLYIVDNQDGLCGVYIFLLHCHDG